MHYPYYMGILDLANGALFLNFFNNRGQKFIDSNLFGFAFHFYTQILWSNFIYNFSLS